LSKKRKKKKTTRRKKRMAMSSLGVTRFEKKNLRRSRAQKKASRPTSEKGGGSTARAMGRQVSIPGTSFRVGPHGTHPGRSRQCSARSKKEKNHSSVQKQDSKGGTLKKGKRKRHRGKGELERSPLSREEAKKHRLRKEDQSQNLEEDLKLTWGKGFLLKMLGGRKGRGVCVVTSTRKKNRPWEKFLPRSSLQKSQKGWRNHQANTAYTLGTLQKNPLHGTKKQGKYLATKKRR